MDARFNNRGLWIFRNWRARLRARELSRVGLLSKSSKKRKDRGFALLVVVVVLVALSLMMGAVISATRNYAQITASHLAALRVRAAFDGGLATIERELSSPISQNAESPGPSRTITIGALSVEIAVRPEVAKVDINSASISLVMQLLLNSGLDARYSKRVAKEILAGPRDKYGLYNIDDDPSDLSARHKYDTLSELALLKDGSSDLLTCLAPDVTVFTHSPDVDPSTASSRVVRAVAAINPAMAAKRGILSAGVTSAVGARPSLYEVTETAKDTESQISFTRQTILRITGDPKRPAWILAETSPAPSEANATSACARLKSNGTD